MAHLDSNKSRVCWSRGHCALEIYYKQVGGEQAEEEGRNKLSTPFYYEANQLLR